MSKVVPLQQAIRVYRVRIWVVLISTLANFAVASVLMLSGVINRSSVAMGCQVILTLLVWVGVFLLIRINKHIKSLRT
jgi:hypothetical protein